MNSSNVYSLIEKNFIDYIISIAGPSKEQDDLRQSKSSIIKKVIANVITNVRNVMKKLEPSYAVGIVRWCSYYGKQFGSFSKG